MWSALMLSLLSYLWVTAANSISGGEEGLLRLSCRDFLKVKGIDIIDNRLIIGPYMLRTIGSDAKSMSYLCELELSIVKKNAAQSNNGR